MTGGHGQKTIVVYSFDPWDHALAYQRYRAAAENLGWKLLRGWHHDLCHFDLIKESDYVLIQRTFPAAYQNYRRIIEIARKENKPVLYEIDDLLIAMPEDHPFLKWFTSTLEYILLAVIEADRVIVSSDVLREVFEPFNPDIETWPSYPPDWIWPSSPPSRSNRSEDKNVRIGFMGGRTHGVDLDLIFPVLQKLADERGDTIEFHFWGSAPSKIINGKLYLHHMEEIIDYRQHAELVRQLKVDIFIAPLVDNLFNRCKSSIKYWEYSALGVGGVYSRLPPYSNVIREGENGFLAAIPEEWYQKLSLLIENTDLRYRIAQNAFTHYSQQGKMSLHLEDWERIFLATRRKNTLSEPSNFRYAYYRFIRQLCDRSEETEELIKQLKSDVQQLEYQSQQLNAIYRSRSWRLVQKIAKIRRILLG